MAASSNLGSDFTGNVKSSAGLGIVLGILTALLGVLLLAYPFFAGTVTTLVIGWTLIVVGLFEVVQAFSANGVGDFFARLLLGLVYGFGGVVLLRNPVWPFVGPAQGDEQGGGNTDSAAACSIVQEIFYE